MTIEIADRLIKLRKQKGLSQEELADKLGLSRQAVSKWERAEASPDTDNLICLAKLYGISLDELLKTDDDVETIVEEQVKKEGKRVEVTKDEGVFIRDDDGKTIHVAKDGVEFIDPDENVRKKKPYVTKGRIIVDAIEATLFTLAIVAYALLGSLLHMWQNAWVVFFIPEMICSVIRAIRDKNASKVNIPFFAIFAFFFVCMVVPGQDANLWHPMWTVFLSIPLYYTFVSLIKKAIKKEDKEEPIENED